MLVAHADKVDCIEMEKRHNYRLIKVFYVAKPVCKGIVLDEAAHATSYTRSDLVTLNFTSQESLNIKNVVALGILEWELFCLASLNVLHFDWHLVTICGCIDKSLLNIDCVAET